MPNIIVEQNTLGSLHARRFLMASLASVMLFPDIKDPNKRTRLEYAIATNLNMNFYGENSEGNVGLNGSDVVSMLKVAALADMSLIGSEKAMKNFKIGMTVGLILERMLYRAQRAGRPVAFWDKEHVDFAEKEIGLHIGQKNREAQMTLFKPVLHFWAAAMRIAIQRQKDGLKFEQIPCDVSELEQFIQYSEMYRKEGETYCQPRNNYTIIPADRSYKIVTRDFELSEIIPRNELEMLTPLIPN